MKKAVFLIILPFLLFLGLSFIFPSESKQQMLVKGIQSSTKVSAVIGEKYLTLTGWSSPGARVVLSSSAGNLFQQTTADQTGFFVFQYVFLPERTGELSLIAQDREGLTSLPLFLPEPPSDYNVFIENILMPPTISLANGEVLPNETAQAAGRSFPQSRVLVYLYSDPKVSLWTRIQGLIVRQAKAKTAPILEVETDRNGNFEFNLPSYEPASQKIFVASLFEKPELPGINYSPKSFTLSFKTLSFWDLLARFILFVLGRFWEMVRKIIEDPTKIIWLEIPILIFLFLKIGLRGITQKITHEEDQTPPGQIIIET